MKFVVTALAVLLLGCHSNVVFESYTEELRCTHEHTVEFDKDLIQNLSLAQDPYVSYRANVLLIFEDEFVDRLERSRRYGATRDESLARYRQMIEEEIYPIFDRDFSLTLQTETFLVWDQEELDAVPRSNGSYDIGALASSIRRWYNASQLWQNHSVMLILTDKSFAAGGFASGRACVSNPIGISKDSRQAIAHELAHQFGIGHDITNEYFPDKYIMNPSLSTVRMEFSPRSKDHFAIWLERYGVSCLDIVRQEEPTPLATFIRGDVNGDGRWTLRDAQDLFGYLYQGKGTFRCDDACDVDDNGKLNINDVTMLLQYMFGKDPKPVPPPPVNGRGPDPTPDELDCPRGNE